MRGRKMYFSLLAAAFLCLFLLGSSLLQSAEPAARPRRDSARPAREPGQRGEPGQFQKERVGQMKEQLQATDEEWVVLEPRIIKVLTLSRQVSVTGDMGRAMRGTGSRSGRGSRGDQGVSEERPGREGAQRQGAGRAQTAIEKSAEDLKGLLNNKDAKPEDIKAQLTALREVREKVRTELAAAQKELRESVSVRQEAHLVLMGVLD